MRIPPRVFHGVTISYSTRDSHLSVLTGSVETYRKPSDDFVAWCGYTESEDLSGLSREIWVRDAQPLFRSKTPGTEARMTGAQVGTLTRWSGQKIDQEMDLLEWHVGITIDCRKHESLVEIGRETGYSFYPNSLFFQEHLILFSRAYKHIWTKKSNPLSRAP